MTSWHHLVNLAAGITWPMSSRHQLANLQLVSVGKRAADITWPMSRWSQLAKEQLTSVGQWEADMSWPIHSWFWLTKWAWHPLANEQLTSLGQWVMEGVMEGDMEGDMKGGNGDMCLLDFLYKVDRVLVLLSHFYLFRIYSRLPSCLIVGGWWPIHGGPKDFRESPESKFSFPFFYFGLGWA